MEISTKCNAKINIGLNVLKKLENGYHELEMMMVPIDLCDILNIKFYNKFGELEIKTNLKGIPVNKENIIYKIYEAFYDCIGLSKEKIEVVLEKNIPSQAGLGGGSSDGAFFLKALNEKHKNILSEQEMIDLGKKVGADIPFFIKNRSSFVSGIGENLQDVENNLDCSVILVKPFFGISTKEAYSNVAKLENKKTADLKKIKDGLKSNNLEIVLANIENTLQQASLIENKALQDFEKNLMNISGVKFFMSGSGSCYFTLLEKERAEYIFGILQNELKESFVFLTNML